MNNLKLTLMLNWKEKEGEESRRNRRKENRVRGSSGDNPLSEPFVGSCSTCLYSFNAHNKPTQSAIYHHFIGEGAKSPKG